MIYILDGIVSFRTEDSVLMSENNGEVIATLTLTLGRLLTYLIENKGEVCTRNDILKNVWEEHGLHSSNNSLNKYVSDMRKLFNAIGLTEKYIITVPRIGFMLSEEINIACEGANLINVQTTRENLDLRLVNKYKFFFLIFCFLIITLLATPFYYDFFYKSKKITSDEFKVVKPFSLGVLNKCRISLVDSTPSTMIEVKKRVAQDLVSKNNIKCDEDSHLFLHISSPVYFGYKGRVFISNCKLNNEKEIFSCYNIYEIDYEAHS